MLVYHTMVAKNHNHTIDEENVTPVTGTRTPIFWDNEPVPMPFNKYLL